MKGNANTAIIFFILMNFANGFPSTSTSRIGIGRQNEDDDSAAANNAGFNVAQIIVGALTGNIDSIVKASFGFIQDPFVNKLSFNTWDTLKGYTTKSPPWVTTPRPTTPHENESDSDPDTDSAQAQTNAKPQLPPLNPGITSGTTSSLQHQPEVYVTQTPTTNQHLSAAIDAAPVPSETYSQLNSQSQFSPTSSPVKTTQPTYATLAPLSIIIEETPSSKPTSNTIDGDDEDVDEAEGDKKGRIAADSGTSISIGYNN